MSMQIPLKTGSKFPEMTVVTTHGTKKLPDDYKGKWLVLFSHPSDYTPVCTTEFVSFAMRYEDFRRLNAELLGLSVDSVYAHIKWVEWIKERFGIEIPFPIIADPTGEVASKLNMFPAGGAHTIRAVLIIDPNGVIRAMLYYPAEIGRNVDEILRLLKALQVSNKYGVALPANWPNNEIVGERAIIPPPTTIADAQERLKRYECFDWWFCHIEIPAEEAAEARKFLERAATKPKLLVKK